MVGIVGVLFGFIPCIGLFAGLLIGALGLLFSGIGLAQVANAKQGKGVAVCGLAISFLAVVWAPLFSLVLMPALFSTASRSLKDAAAKAQADREEKKKALAANQIEGICKGMTFGQKTGTLFLLVDGKERKIKIGENIRFYDKDGDKITTNAVQELHNEDVIVTLEKVNGEDIVKEIRGK